MLSNTPSPFMNDNDLLISVYRMREEMLHGVKLLVETILSNAIIYGNDTEIATLYRECELDEVYDTTAWIFDFNKIYSRSAYASIKARVVFFENDDLMTMNNLADYNPDIHIYKIEILDFI